MGTLLFSLTAATGTTVIILFIFEVIKETLVAGLTAGASLIAMADVSNAAEELRSKNKNPFINMLITISAATLVGTLIQWWVAFIVASVLTPIIAYLLFRLSTRRFA